MEAAVDSGAIDIVANPRDFPGARIEETEESKKGETWTCAGGKTIPKLGAMCVNWVTEKGANKNPITKLQVYAKAQESHG